MKKIILKYNLAFAIAWALIILLLCSTPGRYIPTTSWLELLSFDKFVHASIFFVLTMLWLLYLHQTSKTSTIYVTLLISGCIAYGGLLEIMQSTLFSQRSGDWLDFIANSFGCIMGAIIFKKILLQITSSRKY